MRLSVTPRYPRKRTRPLVAIALLTRNRPADLSRCLAAVRKAMQTRVCDTHLMVWNNGDAPVDGQTHGVGHNVGQHISMNRMIAEADEVGADYLLRIDDDCTFNSRNWLSRLVHIAERHQQKYGRPCVLAPYVHGLRYTPQTLADVWMGKWHLQVVEMLGGICRLMPMSHLRYWRFDERMPMGWSEASNYARYCHLTVMPMLRCTNVEVTHGEAGTNAQEAANPDYAYESEMLKMVPYGL